MMILMLRRSLTPISNKEENEEGNYYSDSEEVNILTKFPRVFHA